MSEDTPAGGPWFRYKLVLVPDANVRGMTMDSPQGAVVDGGVPYVVVAGIGASSPERAWRLAGLRHDDTEDRLRAAVSPHLKDGEVTADGPVLRVKGHLAVPGASGLQALVTAASTVAPVWSVRVDGNGVARPDSIQGRAEGVITLNVITGAGT